MIEVMESRRLCSAVVGEVGGIAYARAGDTLLLYGTPGDDTVFLEPAAGGALRVRGITPAAGEATADFTGVTCVLIDTGAGRDAVFKLAGVSASFIVWLGDGDDVAFDEAQSAGGQDIIFGGNGDDELFDLFGGDILIGGPGDDLIVVVQP
jgi:Ca2+-binding RTX toxin-like protein